MLVTCKQPFSAKWGHFLNSHCLFSFRVDKPKSKKIRLLLSGKVPSNFLHHISYSTKKNIVVTGVNLAIEVEH